MIFAEELDGRVRWKPHSDDQLRQRGLALLNCDSDPLSFEDRRQNLELIQLGPIVHSSLLSERKSNRATLELERLRVAHLGSETAGMQEK